MKQRSGILVLPIIAYLAVSVLAQQASGNDLPPGPYALVDPGQGRIGIDVAVTDAQGHAVTGLTQADFKFLDEGQPMPLVGFTASGATSPGDGDPPVSVVVALDDADLLPANRLEAQSDLEKFLRANGGRLAQPVTVYRVTAAKLYASNQFSSDGNLLADQIASGMNMRAVWKPEPTAILRGPANEAEIMAPSGSDPSLPHYVVTPERETIALKALGAIAVEQRRIPGRKLLFWIGPGWRVDLKAEGGSEKARTVIFNSMTEFSTRLREARIELSVANRWLGREAGRSLLSQNEIDRHVGEARVEGLEPCYNLALQVLAIRSGGELLTTSDDLIAAAKPDRNDIPRLIAEHIAQASHYYRLSFDPPRTVAVDEYHRLHIELARPRLTAHTVTGYYDEPVFYDQPMPATDRMTVAQLEQLLAAKQSDRELADELAELESTERFSTPRLEAWLKRMPGGRSRQALTEVADASVFMAPPLDEVLSLPKPGQAARRAMLSRAADYLAREVPRLPNFYAERTTVQFGEAPPKAGQTWKTAQPDRKLYHELTTTDHIYFEDGKETTDRQKRKATHDSQRDLLETSGTFGPILVLVLKAAASPGGTLTWSRWEKRPSGPASVFDYVSSPNMRNYEVGFCCLAIDQVNIPFERRVTFRGEIAIDPPTGHILRLTVNADLEPRLPLKNSAIMVEYGPVAMGGETYFCPLRSVSTSRQRRVWEIEEWGMRFKLYGAFKTIVNDVTFGSYHLFRSQTTILPGFVPVPQSQ